MALINQSDVIWSILSETDFGVTPTTGVRYELPCSADQAMLTAAAGAIASSAKRPNRASNGSRRGMVSVTGTLDLRLSTAAAFTPLLESAFAGKFDATTHVLKTGTADSSFTIFALLRAGAAGDAMVEEFSGCMANGFTLDVKANDGVTMSFDIMGAERDTLDTDNSVTVTPIPNDVVEFIADEVKNVKIDGQSFAYSEFSFQTSLNRAARGVIGSNKSLAYGVSGARDTTVTIKAYRDSFEAEELITGAIQTLSFDVIGADNKGYRFTGAIEGSIPTTDLSDGSAYVNITCKGRYDATKGTDLSVEKLGG